MKPRIALIVPSLEMGGGVPTVARFIKDTALNSGRYELSIVSLATSARDESSLGILRPGTWWRGVATRRAQWEGLPIVHVGAMIGELEFQRFRPRRALTDAIAGCDILQVVCGSPAWANAVCGLGKPVAVQCATRAKIERRRRDSSPQGFAGWWRKSLTPITDRMDDRALRSVEAIQVENPWMLEYARLVNVGREVDLRYAPPGVDTSLFRPVSQRISNNDAYIFCVGRLNDPRKNVELLLEAYARMAKSIRRTVRLVLAGASAPPASFWTRAEALGLGRTITYIERPERSALIELYQKATAFALPSDEEGFGMVVLEAMACGVPVVSTRSGGPDGILTDGQDGFLVERNDSDALAETLSRLCTDEALNVQIGQRGRRTVTSRHSESVAAETFLDMWDRMLLKAEKSSAVGPSSLGTL